MGRVENGVIYLNNFSIILPVIKSSLKKAAEEFLAKNIITKLGKNIDNASLDTHIYTSPYPSLQKTTSNHVTPRKSYAYGQSITTNHTTWYYLGKKQWIRQFN